MQTKGPADTKDRASQAEVGPLVLVVVVDARGLALLPKLQANLQHVTVVMGQAAEVAGPELPRARLVGLRGHVGAFVAHLALGSGRREIEVAQVVLVDAVPPEPRGRTGVHWLAVDEPEALARVRAQLDSLAGSFEREHALHYDDIRCVGGEREQEACGRCVPACPYGAVARSTDERTRMDIDHLACEGCGACAAACPTGALTLLEPDLVGFLAEVQRRLAASTEPAPWLLVHCGEEGRRFVEGNDLDAGLSLDEGRPLDGCNPPLGGEVLALPCLRAVSDAAILGAFALGAAGLVLVGCESCRHGKRQGLLDTLERNRLVLHALGLESDAAPTAALSRLRLITVADGSDEAQSERVRQELATFAQGLAPSPMPARREPFEQRAANDLVAWALFLMESRLVGAPPALALPPGGPYAHAEVDSEACTVCGSCATICGPSAFQHVETLDEVLLDFRSRSCVACGLCEAICPEDAIRLRPELRLGDDARRHVTVARDAWATCTVCGAPVFSAKALDAIERRLADSPSPAGLPAEDTSTWLRKCRRCRAASMTL